jgi:cyclopropane fatty-acyl-phospholipid synthase-like methyltransferase
VLGKWKKYSACYYRDPTDDLDTAEESMLGAHLRLRCCGHVAVLVSMYSWCDAGEWLKQADMSSHVPAELYIDKLKLADGMSVLELGCGWGSFTLFAVRHMAV